MNEAPNPSLVGALDASFSDRWPLRILLVEDNKLNQKVALGMLARLGYQVQATANGVEAIQAVAQSSFDVVLMDVQMPVMDGLAATRQIVSRSGAAQGPRVVALTAGESAAEREQCTAAGMVDHLAKPISLEALAQVLVRSARHTAPGA